MPRTTINPGLLAGAHPKQWIPEQRAEWITDYHNKKPGILPIPFHDKHDCEFCDFFHALIAEAEREVKHA